MRYIIYILFILLMCGCFGSGQNIRKVADMLDSVPLQSKMVIDKGFLSINSCAEFNHKIEAADLGWRMDEWIGTHISSFDPSEYSFFRIFPDDVFFKLEADDIIFPCNVAVPFNNPGGLWIFVSSNYEYKGYYGYSDHVFADDSKSRRLHSIKVFESQDIRCIQDQLEYLHELNMKNLKSGKRYYIFPNLPFIRESEEKSPIPLERIIGRTKKYD